MIKVKDSEYARQNGGCIVNTNLSEYEKALLRKRNENRVSDIESRIENLETKMDMILDMLSKVIK